MRSTARFRQGNRRSLISLTPLIDVVFILLVFFMLASSFLDWRSIGLTAAANPAGAAGNALEGAVLVDIAADGAIRLSGRPVDRAGLVDALAALIARRPDAGVILRPAPGLPVQALVDLIDLMTAEGITAISVRRGG